MRVLVPLFYWLPAVLARELYLKKQTMESVTSKSSLIHQYAEPVAHTVSTAVEIAAAVIIGVAVIIAMKNYVSLLLSKRSNIEQREIRLQFGSSVAVALELLLGADVIATAVAPTWDDIGKLAAVATIRTALNFFLERDLKSAQQDKNQPAISRSERAPE